MIFEDHKSCPVPLLQDNISVQETLVKPSYLNQQILQSENIQSGVSSVKMFSDSYANALYEHGLLKASRRFDHCGDPVTLYCSHCGHQEVVKYACGLRTCPECSRRLSHFYVSKFFDVLSHLPINATHMFRLITLTTSLDVSKDNMRFIRQVLSKFSKKFNKRGEGMLAGIEAGETGHKLHIHVLHYGKFIKQDDVAKWWVKATLGFGQVVDVRSIKGQGSSFMLRKGLKEVLKYSTKLTSMNNDELANLELSLKGTRRIAAYGMFYRLDRWIRAERKQWSRVCPVCGCTDWITDDGLKFMNIGGAGG